MGKNAKLRTLCEPLLATAREAVAGAQACEPVFGQALYQAQLVAQAARADAGGYRVTSAARVLKENPRFIITYLSDPP